MSDQKQWRKSFPQKMWTFVQFLALLSILFSPLWMQNFSGTPSEAGEPQTLVPTLTRASLTRSNNPNSISSRILTLPSPTASRSTYNFSVETRQIRFEWSEASKPFFLGNNEAPALSMQRNPASSVGSNWILKRIERKDTAKDWQDISLVSGETYNVLGSVFVELDEGENEFRVTFADAKGREEAYPLKVKHSE